MYGMWDCMGCGTARVKTTHDDHQSLRSKWYGCLRQVVIKFINGLCDRCVISVADLLNETIFQITIITLVQLNQFSSFTLNYELPTNSKSWLSEI